MRIVLDANVYISAFINPSGSPGRILDHWRDERFTIFLSTAVLIEVETALRRERVARHLRRPSAWIEDFLADLRRHARFADPGSVDAVQNDPPDNLVLGTAVAAFADYLVSGDRPLLALEQYRGIPIVTPRRFLDVLALIEQ